MQLPWLSTNSESFSPSIYLQFYLIMASVAASDIYFLKKDWEPMSSQLEVMRDEVWLLSLKNAISHVFSHLCGPGKRLG